MTQRTHLNLDVLLDVPTEILGSSHITFMYIGTFQSEIIQNAKKL